VPSELASAAARHRRCAGCGLPSPDRLSRGLQCHSCCSGALGLSGGCSPGRSRLIASAGPPVDRRDGIRIWCGDECRPSTPAVWQVRPTDGSTDRYLGRGQADRGLHARGGPRVVVCHCGGPSPIGRPTAGYAATAFPRTRAARRVPRCDEQRGTRHGRAPWLHEVRPVSAGLVVAAPALAVCLSAGVQPCWA
jgi:hypothetical protein